MITFKENTFVKGNSDELMEMAKAIEGKGAKVCYNEDEESNHLWWSSTRKRWSFDKRINDLCDHELTKSQLYEAYGIVDFSILNERDVFYLETKYGKYLYQGENPLKWCKRVTVDLNSKIVYSSNNVCLENDKKEYKLIRLATPQEIEPYKEHFKTQTEAEKFLEKDENGMYKSRLLENMETRPIQISQETATRWYNGEDNELKQLAIQTFPELDEATPKVGDLCLFADITEQFNNNIGVIGTLKNNLSNGRFERKEGCKWRYCKKIKTIEFYD